MTDPQQESYPHYESDGTQYWMRDGQLHRIGGPAVVGGYGDREWWVNGKRHRTDGPAVVHASAFGPKLEWWLNDEKVSEEEFNRRMAMQAAQDVPAGARDNITFSTDFNTVSVSGGGVSAEVTGTAIGSGSRGFGSGLRFARSF